MSDEFVNDALITNVMMDILSHVGRLEKVPQFITELEQKYSKEVVDEARRRINKMLEKYPGAVIDDL